MEATGFKRTMAAFFAFLLILLSLSLPANAAVPAAPAGLTAIAGNGEASLSWITVSGATDYLLYRQSVIGGAYSFVAQTQGTGHTNRSLSNGKPYYYVVTAMNGDGQSTYSAAAGVTPTLTVLKAPDGVTAIPGNGQVSLVWNPVTSAVSYNVLRATSRGGPYTLLAPAAPGPSFTDREATNDIQYFYAVQTMSTDLGAYSEEVGATPSALLPSAPANFVVSPGSTWAGLSWSPVDGATAYAVYRGTTTGGPYKFVALPNTITYEDTGLYNRSDGAGYYYVVAAVSANGRGANSAEASATVSSTEKPHAALISLAQAGDHFANISWGQPPGAVSYTVLRSTISGGPYPYESLPITGPITGLSYSDRDLTNGITYYYVVDTHNASATITRSNEVAVTPVAQLPSPGNVAVIVGNTQATVTWEPVVGALSHTVTAATSPGGSGSTSCYENHGSSCKFSGLTNGQIYYFRVRTYSSGGSAPASSELSATPSATLPLAPTGLTVTSGNTQMSLTWTAVSGATSYKVYRRTEGSAWPAAPAGTSTGTLFTDTGLVNGTKYYYSVAAVNADGTGAWSYEDSTPSATKKLPPTNVAVVAGNTQATVTWDPVVGAAGYWDPVVGAAGSYGNVIVATSPGGQGISPYNRCSALSCTITDLTNGQIYYFRVKSSPSDGGLSGSVYSAEVSTTPLVTLPLAPTGSGLNVTSGNTQLRLTWTAVSGATSYKVYRRTKGSAWPAAPVGTSTGTLFTDTGLVNGTTYYYSVVAVNADGTGAWSDEVYKTPTVATPSSPITSSVSLNIVSGWNLVGNSSNGSLDVVTALGDASKVITAWKWVANAAKWAFYAPSLAGQALSDYAAGKGYDVLTTINGGEGFWINANAAFTAPLPSGTPIDSASFEGIASGWNLIAIGDGKTPSEFNALVGAATPLTTLWTWDTAQTNWYFYAPSLEAKGGTALTDYITSKGYLDFGTKTLGNASGFWVNKP